MLIHLIYIVLTLFTTIFYINGKYEYFLLLLSILIFNGFGLFPLLIGDIDSNGIYNYALLIIFFVCVKKKLSRNSFFTTKNDSVGQVLIIIVIYQFCVTLFSGLRNVDTWINVLGQYRFCLVVLFYFLFKNIPVCIYENFFSKLLKILLIIIPLYAILIFYGNSLLNVQTSFKACIFALTPSFFYMIINNECYVKPRNRKYVLGILVIGIFSLLARLFMFTFLLCVIYYMVKIEKKAKYVFLSLCILPFIFLLLSLMDAQKSQTQESNDLATEISIIQSSSDYSDYNASSGVLRFISIMERSDYMSENPIRFLFGIGPMKEITAQQKLSFISGSHGTLEDGGKTVVLQIDTDDIGLLSSFVRYGFVYIILFSIWMKKSIVRFKKYQRFRYMKTGLLLSLMMLLSIPCIELFHYAYTLFPLLMLQAISSNFRLYEMQNN